MDETYAEDSFVVGSEVEEQESSEEEAGGVELLPEISFVDGQRQYATRRRVFLHKARATAADSKTEAKARPEHRAGVKAKCSRVIRMDDSSDEETEKVSEKKSLIKGGGGDTPLWPEVAPSEHRRSQLNAPETKAVKVSLQAKAPGRSDTENQKSER